MCTLAMVFESRYRLTVDLNNCFKIPQRNVKCINIIYLRNKNAQLNNIHMETIQKKVIRKESQVLGSTEYTLNIDFKLPEGIRADTSGHFTRLYVTFRGKDEGPEKQKEVIKEHPDFPLGVPVRGTGKHVDLIVTYRIKYVAGSDPNPREAKCIYEIPVDFSDSSTLDKIELNETLPLS